MTVEKFDIELALAFLHWASESSVSSSIIPSVAKGLLLKLRKADELAEAAVDVIQTRSGDWDTGVLSMKLSEYREVGGV